MTQNARSDGRSFPNIILIGLIVALTLATAYIHYYVGGMMLMLNAGGYLGLTVLVVGSAIAYRRALPLILVALAGYALVTILGWLVMGPYFDVAYLAKAIEIGLILTIGIQLAIARPELADSIAWARGMAARVLGRGASGSAEKVARASGEE